MIPPPVCRVEAVGKCQVDWIATDIDGTFLDAHHRISGSTIATYKELKDRGVKIVPATGRTVRALRRVAEQSDKVFAHETLSYYPGVYANGAFVVGDNEDDIIYKSILPNEVLLLFTALCYEWQEAQTDTRPPLHILACHTKGMLMDFDGGIWPEYETMLWEEEGHAINAQFRHVDQLHGLEFTHASALCRPTDIENLLEFISSNQEFQERAKAAGLQTVSPIPNLVSALPRHDNKANGMKKLFERYPHMEHQPWLFLGDGMNDLELLRFAPRSVAMGQAKPIVQQAAKVVGKSNGEDGWAEAIKKYAL